MLRRCPVCHRHGERVRNSKLCTPCFMRGWRWCSIGKHPVLLDVYESYQYACRTCWREDNKQRARKRSHAVPPVGYIGLVEAAQRLHYDRRWLCFKVRRGDYAGHVWQHRPRSTWFIDPQVLL